MIRFIHSFTLSFNTVQLTPSKLVVLSYFYQVSRNSLIVVIWESSFKKLVFLSVPSLSSASVEDSSRRTKYRAFFRTQQESCSLISSEYITNLLVPQSSAVEETQEPRTKSSGAFDASSEPSLVPSSVNKRSESSAGVKQVGKFPV